MLAVIIASIGSLLGTVANIPQIIRIVKLKEANAISYNSLFLKMSALLCFVIAVMITGSFLVALINGAMILSNIVIMWLKFYYSQKRDI